MKVHRFEIAFPLSGGSRKRQKYANSRLQCDDESESGDNSGVEDKIDIGIHFPRMAHGVDRPTGEGNISSDSRLSRIRRNIAEGYYDSPEFLEKLADTLIKKLYPEKDHK